MPTSSNTPPVGNNTVTVVSPTNVTINPFAGATVTSPGDVTLVLTLSNITNGSNPNGETMYIDAGGSTQILQTITGTGAGTVEGDPATFIGSAAAATSWLQSIFVFDWANTDRFRLTLQGSDESGDTGTGAQYSYRITCFLRGTNIATPAGERAVETLQIGDLVTTLDGSAKQIKWIGHRTYEAEFGAAEAFVRPVLFRAGSLGGGLPVRDLRVSPQHGMLIDGVMVPAATLVNGVSIVRDETVQDTQYFHIELEGHAAILSEGAPSETFIDLDSRAMFDNADEYGLLYGASETVASPFARVEEGWQLAAIRARLAKLAGVELAASAGSLRGSLESLEDGVLTGWVAGTTGEAVEAEVLVDGEVVATLVANRYRADLDQAGISGGRCAFTVTLPPSAESLAQVSLRRIGAGGELQVAAKLDFVIG
jgi:hypothetical protein